MMIVRGMLEANTNAIAASAYSTRLNFWNFLNFVIKAFPFSDKACTILTSVFLILCLYFTTNTYKKQQKRTLVCEREHVTHVTGIACGNGWNSDGIYRGIAPDTNIVSVKILDRYGQGNSTHAVLGLRWIMDNARKYNIKVVNLSIGTNDRKVNLPLKEAVERLWQMGIVVVVAAGNPDGRNGYRPPPAVSSGVISVGAWEDRSYFQAPVFPLFTKEGGELPDLWAPGEEIVSVLSPDFDFTLPNRSRQNIVAQHYITMSGASMATPLISGAAALLLARNPRAHPAEIKKLLLQKARPFGSLLTEEVCRTF